MSDPTFPGDDARLDAVVDAQVTPENLAERRLRELADSARSAATPKELAALDTALIAFAAHQREVIASTASEPGATWSRRALARWRPSVRVGAAAAVLVMLGAGTAAAATTGQLPTPLQHIAHSTLGAPEPVRHHGHHHAAVAAASAHHSADAVTHPTHSPSAKPSPTSTTSEPQPSDSPDPSSSPRGSHTGWGVGAVDAHASAHHAHHRLGHHQNRDTAKRHHTTKHHQGSTKPGHHHGSGSSAPSSSANPSPSSGNTKP